MSHSNRILSIVSAFLLMAVAAVAQDLVKVAPKNVKVLLDNSQVRVLEYTAKKGVKIGHHAIVIELKTAKPIGAPVEAPKK